MTRPGLDSNSTALSLPECHARLLAEVSEAVAKHGKQVPALITLKRMSAKGRLDECRDPSRVGANMRPRYLYPVLRAIILAELGLPTSVLESPSTLASSDAGERGAVIERGGDWVANSTAQPLHMSPPVDSDDEAREQQGRPSAFGAEPVREGHRLPADPGDQLIARLDALDIRLEGIERTQAQIANESQLRLDAVCATLAQIAQAVQGLAHSTGESSDAAQLSSSIAALDDLRKSLMLRFDAENAALRQRLEQTTEALNQARAAASGLDTVRLVSLLSRLENFVQQSALQR